MVRGKAKVIRIQRGHHPSSTIMCWGVLWNGAIVIQFCMLGAKTNTKIYEETILESVVKPVSDTLFKEQHWIFQQDSAPAHKSKMTHKQCSSIYSSGGLNIG